VAKAGEASLLHCLQVSAGTRLRSGLDIAAVRPVFDQADIGCSAQRRVGDAEGFEGIGKIGRA